METGRSPIYLFLQADVGLSWRPSAGTILTVRNWSNQVVTDNTLLQNNATSDSSYSPEDYRGGPFFRFTAGMVPSTSGPWFMVQFLPDWTLAEWGGDTVRTETITTTQTQGIFGTSQSSDTSYSYSAGSGHSLVTLPFSVSGGWVQRFGDKSVLLGFRYVSGDGGLKRTEVLVQTSLDLGGS
jgi:hypothetical protein